MTRREELQERYEDALFALLMDDFVQAEEKRLEEENKALQSDPDAAVPEEVQRRCIRTIRRCFAARRAQSAGRAAVKLLNRTAVVAMVGVLLFTAAFAASPELRVGTFNLVMEVFDDGTVFELEDISEMQDTSALRPHIKLNWIPDGFTLQEFNPDIFGGEEYCYVKGQEKITISLVDSSTGVVLDTEDTQVSAFDINSYEATQIIKGDVIQIIWADVQEGFIIHIYSTGGASAEDIQKIAKNLQILK